MTQQRVHFISGASGAGTSTRAIELRRAWEAEAGARPVHLLATDVVRAQLRTALTREEHPDLWGESFDLPARAGDRVVDDVAVDAFLRQCEPIMRAVEAGAAQALDEGWDVIVEGVHVVPGLLRPPPPERATSTFELLVVDDHDLHRERFAARDVASAGRRAAAHYVANLARIRVIQEELRERARHFSPRLPPVS